MLGYVERPKSGGGGSRFGRAATLGKWHVECRRQMLQEAENRRGHAVCRNGALLATLGLPQVLTELLSCLASSLHRRP